MTGAWRHVIGWGLAVMTTVLVLVNQQQVGIARDEVVYIQNGAHYAEWWLSLGKGGITRTFGGPGPTDNNREHPPFVKTLFGFSNKLFHAKLALTDEVTASRIPAAALHGVAVLLVFYFVLGLWGMLEAILAALLLIWMPRALFHAGLACFDAPIMTMWFATVYAYHRCLDGRRWPWQVGVMFGLALATKHTALLLPFALGTHYLILGARQVDRGLRQLVLHRWRVIVSLAVLGPLTLIAVWPWLWFDTVAHLRAWLTFHLTHVHYNYEYLGHNWNAPRFPWHVALVTTLYTVPVATLAGALLGAGVWVARHGRNPDHARAPVLLLALSGVASMGPFFLGSTPIFGAEKHWMPALPTICIAAAVGIAWAARAAVALLQAPRTRSLVVGAVCGLVVAAAAVETITAQPYALTWYNALAGGAPGGADRGMNRQFWGVAAKGVLPVLAADAPGAGQPAKPVYTHDAAPAWGFYLKQGLVPRTLPDAGWEQAGIEHSQLALVIHELHFNRHDYMIWKAYGTVQPWFVLRTDGVPIVSVYRRR